MTRQWLLETQGEPLETVQEFIANIWEQADIDRMLLPIKSEQPPYWHSILEEDTQSLKRFNPFAPLMIQNAAKQIPQILQEYPDLKIGAFLRPCEIRSLIEMGKHEKMNREEMLTISADCLGTFPDDEYSWRVERKGSPEKLSQDSVKFSRQGGIVSYRYRAACQACQMPIARSADINIGVIGLPVRQHMIVTTPNGISDSIDFDRLTHGNAPADIIAQHEEMAQKVLHRRTSTRERISRALADNLPENIDEIITQFKNCGDCQICMQGCPICEVIMPQKDATGKYLAGDILQWLTSCVGCGVCEQACPTHEPISIMFSYLRSQIPELAEYIPGSLMEKPAVAH